MPDLSNVWTPARDPETQSTQTWPAYFCSLFLQGLTSFAQFSRPFIIFPRSTVPAILCWHLSFAPASLLVQPTTRLLCSLPNPFPALSHTFSAYLNLAPSESSGHTPFWKILPSPPSPLNASHVSQSRSVPQYSNRFRQFPLPASNSAMSLASLSPFLLDMKSQYPSQGCCVKMMCLVGCLERWRLLHKHTFPSFMPGAAPGRERERAAVCAQGNEWTHVTSSEFFYLFGLTFLIQKTGLSIVTPLGFIISLKDLIPRKGLEHCRSHSKYSVLATLQTWAGEIT